MFGWIKADVTIDSEGLQNLVCMVFAYGLWVGALGGIFVKPQGSVFTVSSKQQAKQSVPLFFNLDPIRGGGE